MSLANSHRLPSIIAFEDEYLLVAAVKTVDDAAFEELVNRYERKIFGLTLNITNNREDAEDAPQDAFLKRLRISRTSTNNRPFARGWYALLLMNP